LDYYRTIGMVTDYLLDLDMPNEELIGYVLDIKVCWDILNEKSMLDKYSLAQALFEIRQDKDMHIVSLLSEKICNINSYKEENEEVFC